MTEEKKFSIQYLTKKDVELIHSVLSKKAKEDGEPIPPFSLVDRGDIDALVNIPQRGFFGIEQYSTIESKAAIIFYTVNKRQIFLNGNKRMSTVCLLVFLNINGKNLEVVPDELTQKALWLAQTSSFDFHDIKEELENWIQAHIRDRDGK